MPLDTPAQTLTAIPGRVPPLDAMPTGCRFAPRCPLVQAGCDIAGAGLSGRPSTGPAATAHSARCHVATGHRAAA